MAKQKKPKSKSKNPASTNEPQKSKPETSYTSEETCESIELVKVPISTIIKNIEKIKETYSSNDLCELANMCTLAAGKLCKSDEYKSAKERAMIALDLYEKLEAINYSFHPKDRAAMNLAEHIIMHCSLVEALI
jgi:hypothetical protein